jgi:hydrogenase expression/formation protein HypC
MKVLEIDGSNAVVELGGVKKSISMGLLDDVKVGEYVIVHAGFAIQKIDDKEAVETIEILKEMAR